jgi:hypothetical protein
VFSIGLVDDEVPKVLEHLHLVKELLAYRDAFLIFLYRVYVCGDSVEKVRAILLGDLGILFEYGSLF